MKETELLEREQNEIIEVEEMENVNEPDQSETIPDEEDSEIKRGTPNWMSFLVGVRGDSIYECKTNLDPCVVSDYVEASAGIDMNIAVQLLKSNGISSLETFFKLKEILVLNSVRMIGENIESVGLTEEQYSQLRDFFKIDEIEKMLNDRREELINNTNPQEEKYEIEM